MEMLQPEIYGSYYINLAEGHTVVRAVKKIGKIFIKYDKFISIIFNNIFIIRKNCCVNCIYMNFLILQVHIKSSIMLSFML